MSPAPPLLEVDDLRVTFATDRGDLRAVDGVSLNVAAASTLGLVGESGSGKTVFSRALLRLLACPPATISGRVLFQGQDLSRLSEEELRAVRGRQISIVFQDPMTSLNPVMKIGAQISEVLEQHLRASRRHAWRRAAELLALMRIPDPKARLEEYPHQLSGGMRQRVTIAMAVACEPKLLIADEPTTALDVTVQAQILDLLQSMRAEFHMAVILISHDLGVVAGRTDEIAVMYAGRVVEKAPTAVLFNHVRMPYTEALLRSIPRLDQPSHLRLRAIPGRPPDLIQPPSGCRFHPRCEYARERCRTDEPDLRAGELPGQSYACWYPVETATAVRA